MTESPKRPPKRPYVNSTVFYKIETLEGRVVLRVRNFPYAPPEALNTILLTEHPKASRWYKNLRLDDDVVGMIITPDTDSSGLRWVEYLFMNLITQGGRFYVGQGLVEGQVLDEDTGQLVTVKCARKSEGVIQVVQQWFTHDEAHPEVTPELGGVSQDLAKMLEAALNPPLNPLDT